MKISLHNHCKWDFSIKNKKILHYTYITTSPYKFEACFLKFMVMQYAIGLFMLYER